MDDYDSAAAEWSVGVADPDPVGDSPAADIDPAPLEAAPLDGDATVTDSESEPGAGAMVEGLPGPAVEQPGDIPETDTAGEIDLTATEDGVHGNPAAWTLGWFYQQIDGYCGPSAVAQIVSQYTGVDIADPQSLVDRATELGLMDDPARGMTLPDIEALLEDQGVPATITTSSLDDLRARLDAGYGVIAMVDSGELWRPDQEAGEDDTPDHVLVVAGIDDARGVVILSDPGVPYGNQLEVPIEQFEDAWADSEYRMLVTDAPDDGLIAPTRPAPARADRSAIITL